MQIKLDKIYATKLYKIMQLKLYKIYATKII